MIVALLAKLPTPGEGKAVFRGRGFGRLHHQVEFFCRLLDAAVLKLRLDGGSLGLVRSMAFAETVVLNPNLATLWLLSGWIRTYLSEPEIAIEYVTRAMRLSPFDPQAFVTHLVIGFAHFIAGRYEEAALWVERALREQSHFAGSVRFAAASNAYLGRMERAQTAMARLRQIDSSLRLSNLKHSVPLRDPEDFARLVEGLRRAGLPE